MKSVKNIILDALKYFRIQLLKDNYSTTMTNGNRYALSQAGAKAMYDELNSSKASAATLNNRINVDSAMTDCDSPTTSIGSYNSSTLGTPYKSGQTASAGGLIFSFKRGSAPWNKQLAFTDGSGEFYLRSTTDTSAWTAWQRLVPRFVLQAYSASVTTGANGVGHAEYNIGVSGFVPVAIHTATTNHGNVVLQHVSINGTKANIYAKNTTTSSITSTWTIYIFYVSSGFGV